MNFGEALSELKKGNKAARAGWNGKGMYLFYSPSGVAAGREEGQPVLHPLREFVVMKTAQGDFVPWLASQTDVLANDWTIVEG